MKAKYIVFLVATLLCFIPVVKANNIALNDNDLVTLNFISKQTTLDNNSISYVEIGVNDWDADSCDSLLGNKDDSSDPAYYLFFAFNLIKYAAIILLLVFTVIDFFKATTTSDHDALKKASIKAIKRVLIAAIIFFLPTLIDFIFRLLGITSDPTCGLGG